jgi:hypothetical protein
VDRALVVRGVVSDLEVRSRIAGVVRTLADHAAAIREA